MLLTEADTIHIADDFDLRRIAESGQCFRWEALPDGEYRVKHGADCLYIRALGGGDFVFDCPAEALPRWVDYFDLGTDYAAIRAAIDPADAFLTAAAAREQGIRILRQDPWEALVCFLISQNKNIPAIEKCVERLAEKCGAPRRDSRGAAYHAFPTPEALAALSEAELRGCSLGYRWSYLLAAAGAVLSGALELEALRCAPEEETCAALRSVRGVGPKVASCVSLFGLHHLDAFPRDVWINRVLANEYPAGYPLERYAPWNGVYQQYMFAYYRNETERKRHDGIHDRHFQPL